VLAQKLEFKETTFRNSLFK